MDIAISFPSQGQIRLQSHHLFAEPGNDTCREFLQRVFQASEITDVTINSHQGTGTRRMPTFASARRCTRFPRSSSGSRCSSIPAGTTALWPMAAFPVLDDRNGHENGVAGDAAAPASGRPTPARGTRRDDHERNPRAQRQGADSLLPLRLGDHQLGDHARDSGTAPDQEPSIHRKADLCQAIERELMSVLGVDYYTANPLTATVLVKYDTKELTRDQIIEIIDGPRRRRTSPAQGQARSPASPLHDLGPVCRGRPVRRARPLARGRGPLPLHVDPHVQERQGSALGREAAGGGRPGCIVVVGCMGTMSIFPGAVLCWCLGFGRVLVKRTQDNSKKLLLNAFGKQPRFVWLYRDGVEVQVSLDRSKPATSSSSTRARWCRWTASSPKGWR